MRRYIMRNPSDGAVEWESVDLSLAVENTLETMVGWCRLKPVFASTGYDILRFGSLTQCPCVMLCDHTTCYSIENAWFHRLILKCGRLL
jgi:hypothetical protein